MATNFFLSNYAALEEATRVNTSSYFGGATLVIFDGTQPTNANIALGTSSPPQWSGNTTNILAVFTLPAAGANTVANGANDAHITFGTISNTTANKSGTATWFRILNGATVNGAGNQISVAGNTICDGNVGTSGSDCNLNTTSIVIGATVSITSFIFTITE